MMDDWELLQAYARDRSEPAFAKLISRHLDWVYSVAVRQVGDPHLAEDVAQSVFVLLARKATDLRPGTLVNGWLFRTTRNVAAHARRAEQRRKTRETTACNMIHDTTSPDTSEVLWEQLAPHLDQAVASLSEADRSAILLRFYGKRPLRDVGEKLGISDDAAKKRVSRALDRMRTFLERRGVRLSGIALGAILAEKTVQTASAVLASTVLKISIAVASTSGSAALPQLARETLRAWRATQVKLSMGLAAASLAVILVTVSVGVSARRVASQSAAPNASLRVEAAMPPQTRNANDSAAPASPNQTQPLKKTGAITGSVMDEAGRRIAGARVWGGSSQQPFTQDTTDSSGEFALDKTGAPSFVTVTADGFAADQQAFEPTNVAGPMVFRLSPVPQLNLRVVDESGAGVRGVSPFLSQWWGRAGTLAQYLPQQTDSDGRLQWLSPPKGELELQLGANGYRYSRTNRLVADNTEHLIVLHPAATVTGKVTDAETGNPVASFKYTQGRSQPWHPEDQIPLWDLQSHTGSDGAFKVAIEEEQAPFLRIEAAGYDTVETALQLTNATAGVCNIQLRPRSVTNSIRGTVLLPGGRPAVGVEVALCTAKVGVMLKGTQFEPGAFGLNRSEENADYRRKTDEQGAFSFDPRPGAHTVVAVSPAGVGQARCFDFSKPMEIRLQPWGRIEGTVRTRDGAWANRKLEWNSTGNLTSWMTLFYDTKGFSTSSDADGKFVLENIPPGIGRLKIEDQGSAPILSEAIQVNPGETSQIQIGGVGQAVTGRLVAPPGVEIRSWTNQVTISELNREGASYAMPEGLTGNAAERWRLEFADTEAGRAWFRDQCLYEFKVGADGSFTIPEVLPGKYRLFVSVAQGYLGSGTASSASSLGDPQIASSGMLFSVPDAPANSGAPLDLGDINLANQ